MNQPSYGSGILRALVRGAIADLDPAPSSVTVMMDTAAESACGATLAAALKDAGCSVRAILWDAAEEKKTFIQAEILARQIVSGGVDRQSLLIAAGGGVTTDMGGFLAATLLRGIRWGAIPTTLLGMADAALGGKTALNLPEGKNLIGAFHHPEFVICDAEVLATLPERHWNSGLGEILKTAFLAGEDALALMEEAAAADLRRPSDSLLNLLARAGETKMRIVREDPEEQGTRKLLTLGHTFGHALETAAGPDALTHGEAITLGFLCAARMSVEMEVAEKAVADRIRNLVRQLKLPEAFPGPLPSDLRLEELITRDKKAVGGKLDLVLPVEPGSCILVRGVDPKIAIQATIRELG